MNAPPYVGQHQCLRYATLVHLVSIGLGYVIKDGLLPPCYQASFRAMANFCDDIIAGLYFDRGNSEATYGVQVAEIFEATTWFLSLAKCYPHIFDNFSKYSDAEEIIGILEFLASGYSHPRAYPKEKLRSVRTFFLTLWGAVEQECRKEGVLTGASFAEFHETSLRLQ